LTDLEEATSIRDVATSSENPQVLIGESFKAADRYLYVYRDRGDGKSDGSYVKRYDAVVEVEDLERDLGPGSWILVQNNDGTGRPIHKRVYIPGAPGKDQQPNGGGDRLEKLREIVEMRILADQMKPAGSDPLELVKLVLELTGKNTPADPLDAFLQGAEYFGENENPLTAIAQGIMGGQEKTDPAKVDAAIQSGMKAVAKRLEQQDKAIRTIATAVANLRPAGPPTETNEKKEGDTMGVDPREIVTAILASNFNSSGEIAELLRIFEKAQGGDVRKMLAGMDEKVLKKWLKMGLEDLGRGDIFMNAYEGIRLFLRG